MKDVPITVIMAVYNGERYLREAIDSILSQTYDQFELLVINDGSTDGSREILESYDDWRIRVIHTKNNGLASSLRLAVNNARGNYIARMDHDDICMQDRLKIQKRYMDEHPDVVICYSLVDCIDSRGNVQAVNVGEGYSDIEIKWLMIWQNFLYHSSVMIRVKVLRKFKLNYRPKMDQAEDFDLWGRLSRVGNFLFIKKALVKYRMHTDNITAKNTADHQHDVFSRVISANMARYNVRITKQEAGELAIISGKTKINPITYHYRILPWRLHTILESLTNEFIEYFSIPRNELSVVQSKQLLRWARYMLGTSRKYSTRLLISSITLNKNMILTYLFWTVLIAVTVPAKGLRIAEHIRIRIKSIVR